MARGNITAAKQDIIDDDGSILLSLIQGEIIEWEITLDFVELLTPSYVFEAVIIEGANDGAGSKPSSAEPAGIESTLTTRIAVLNGAGETWNSGTTYLYGEYVLHVGIYYYAHGDPTVALDPPSDPDNWEVFTRQRVWIQFTGPLADSYAVQPGVDNPVYGFFELRVTEPTNAVFTRTWKPTRGLIEFRYSPTHLV